MMLTNYKIARCTKCNRTYTMDKFRPMSEHKAPFPCLNEGCEGSVFVPNHIYKIELNQNSHTYYKRSLWCRLKSWIKKIFGIKESIKGLGGTAPKFTESKIMYDYQIKKDGYITYKLEAKN